MRTANLTIALALLVPCVAQADDLSACSKFKWSIERERLLLASPKPLAADGSLDIGVSGFHVALADSDKFAFSAKPQRAPKPGTHASRADPRREDGRPVRRRAVRRGLDNVVDHGQTIASTAFSGQKGCPGVRKSVRIPRAADWVAFTVTLSACTQQSQSI